MLPTCVVNDTRRFDEGFEVMLAYWLRMTEKKKKKKSDKVILLCRLEVREKKTTSGRGG